MDGVFLPGSRVATEEAPLWTCCEDSVHGIELGRGPEVDGGRDYFRVILHEGVKLHSVDI